MLFRTSCGHVTRHRNSRVRREADAACKPLRRGYKVVTAICCKSSKNFTKTPKKRRIFLFQSPWRLCRTKGVVAGATREQEWVMRAPGERSGSRAGVRTGRDNEGAGRSGIMQEPNGAMRKPNGSMRKPNGSTRGTTERTQAGDGAASASPERSVRGVSG